MVEELVLLSGSKEKDTELRILVVLDLHEPPSGSKACTLLSWSGVRLKGENRAFTPACLFGPKDAANRLGRALVTALTPFMHKGDGTLQDMIGSDTLLDPARRAICPSLKRAPRKGSQHVGPDPSATRHDRLGSEEGERMP